MDTELGLLLKRGRNKYRNARVTGKGVGRQVSLRLAAVV